MYNNGFFIPLRSIQNDVLQKVPVVDRDFLAFKFYFLEDFFEDFLEVFCNGLSLPCNTGRR